MGRSRRYIYLNIGEVVLEILPDAWEIEEVPMGCESLAELEGCGFLEVLGRECWKGLGWRVSQ